MGGPLAATGPPPLPLAQVNEKDAVSAPQEIKDMEIVEAGNLGLRGMLGAYGTPPTTTTAQSWLQMGTDQKAEVPSIVPPSAAHCAGGVPTEASAEDEGRNSGKLLLLFLKGTREPERPKGAAGVLPESLRGEKWEPLVRPFAVPDDPKRFVGAEHFNASSGIAVSGSGNHPCVLKDVAGTGLMVMFKPSGWATCSTPHWEGVDGNLIRWVWQRPGCTTAAPCHRLDRGTSGAVIVAKTRESLRCIASQITGHTLVKQYLALCHGKIDPPQGALSIPLALSSTDKPLGACAGSDSSRSAITRYRVLGYFGHGGDETAGPVSYSLVQLQIDHGRQHQIRLHMASIGHPLVYDAKYNPSMLREDAKVCPRLFLHAAFVQCQLPPDAGSGSSRGPLHVACRLPSQLKTALNSTLVRRRFLEDSLLLEARKLCDALLTPDLHTSSSSATGSNEAFESRMAARRRDEFLRSYNFTNSEREEVVRILAKLPTAEERNNALLRFRIFGHRTSDFIVERFDRFVDGLLRNCGPKAEGDTNTNVGSVQDTPGFVMDNSGHGHGPVSFNTEFIFCEVCGREEKIDTVGYPALRLRLSCRSLVEQQTMALGVARLFDSAGGASGCSAARCFPVSSSVSTMSPPDTEESASSADSRSKAHNVRSAGKQPFAKEVHPQATDSSNNGSAKAKSDAGSKLEDLKDNEAKLSAELLAYLKACGNECPGPAVSSELAARYNAWIRKDAKRNDGSLRRWIAEQPGVSVEHCGGNQWKVHLEEEEGTTAGGKGGKKRGAGKRRAR